MLRKVTKSIGRMKAGEVHDYPKAVWQSMAKSAKVKLESFSEEVEFNPGLQSPLRGPVRVRPRFGSTQ